MFQGLQGHSQRCRCNGLILDATEGFLPLKPIWRQLIEARVQIWYLFNKTRAVLVINDYRS